MPPLTPTLRDAAPPRARRPGARRGMSLVEILIVFVLMGALTTLLLRLFLTQSTVFARTQASTAVQRDMRAGLSLLPQDLRAASRTRGDLLSVTPTAIELRATIGSTIVCNAQNNGRTLVVPPVGQVNTGNTLTTWFTPPAPADDVFVLTRAVAGAQGDWWIVGQLTQDPQEVATGLPSADLLACLAPLPFVTSPLPAVRPPLRLRLAYTDTLNAQGQTVLPATAVRPGLPLRITRRVRYQLYQEGSGRWYLGFQEHRGNGVWSALSPVAGPYEAATAAGPGIAFSYTDTAGVVLAAPINPRQVARVDLILRPRTTARTAQQLVVRDSLLVRIALRNRCTVGFERC